MTSTPDTTPAASRDACCSGGGCCGPGDPASRLLDHAARSRLQRREFLKLSAAAAAAGLAGGSWPFDARHAVAGPFQIPGPDEFPIPADKKFDPRWIDSLSSRGEPTVYRSRLRELDFIGMPIGGICCGQVYLGGDGKLWHWDIFNLPQASEWSHTSGPLYAKPARQASPIEQGFALRVTSGDKTQERRLDASGFADIEFRGQYPIGQVRYTDAACPVRVDLEAFSPFCPLDEALSGTPAIVLNYTLTNTSDRPVRAALAGWLQNPVCKQTGLDNPGKRIARVSREAWGSASVTTLECTARALRPDELAPAATRPEIVFEDWERGTLEGWTVTGTAFGDRPRNLADIAGYQGALGAQGKWTVNTHESRHGENVGAADAHIGTLTSRTFTIERPFISFRIGGGKHPGQTCVNLLVDGAPVRTATGLDSNRMRFEHFDVKEFAGREARIQIVDGWTGAWGHIGCDEITFGDRPRRMPYEMEQAPDFGSMSLSVEGPASRAGGRAAIAGAMESQCFDTSRDDAELIESPLTDAASIGCVSLRDIDLGPGESTTVRFVIAWWFPNPDRGQLSFLQDSSSLRRWYAGPFSGAADVRAMLFAGMDRIESVTRLWRDTWYDSSLPYWFLDRTFATISTAATATCWRFDNGRFYGWEGTYCCAGTCTHVWQYAQGLARVFPALERSTRELVDFGLAFREETGQIDYRAEAARDLAVDGQCGTILRAFREHQMSVDDRFLRAVWPRVKKATELMLSRDTNADGVLDGAQYNTLDTTWYGQIAWLTSLYLAAVRAGEAMAREMKDEAFTLRCRQVAERGSANMVARLFNGEYFVHLTDPAHPETNSTGTGCHIDQLLGQSWAHQVGLGRIVPLDKSQAALRSLYRYSFAPDIGPYRAVVEKTIKGGRWYAMPGEGGLLMCTWPKGGADAAAGKGGDSWAAGYFNECMSGFEHQVASHMIHEGLITEGLAVTRMIHDRHHARLRNPYNEVECSNHYARAMACYGSFVTITGFEHDGPRGRVAWAPRLTPDDFKAAFICAGGWGQFRQQRLAAVHRQELEVRWGTVRLSAIDVQPREGWTPRTAVAEVGGRPIACVLTRTPDRCTVRLEAPLDLARGQTLRVELHG